MTAAFQKEAALIKSELANGESDTERRERMDRLCAAGLAKRSDGVGEESEIEVTPVGELAARGILEASRSRAIFQPLPILARELVLFVVGVASENPSNSFTNEERREMLAVGKALYRGLKRRDGV